MFGVVYSEKKTGRAFFKRTRIAQFIKDREYRIAPEGCRLELITPRPNAIYEIKVDTPIKASLGKAVPGDLFSGTVSPEVWRTSRTQLTGEGKTTVCQLILP